MTGFVLGAAMLAASMGLPPTVKTVPVAPTTFTLERAAAHVDWENPRPGILPEPTWHRASSSGAPVAQARRVSTTGKVIAIAAGAAGGFLAGAYIGGAIADNRDNPHDDVSLLRGVMIGAPVGAVVGGLIGWRLTR